MPVNFVKSSLDFDKYLQNNRYLVANFTAAWCGPCQAIKPLVDNLYNDPDQKYSRVEIVRIDLDTQKELAQRYQVSSIPTFIAFENGQETSRVQGANVPKVTQMLDSLSSKAEVDGHPRKGNGATTQSPLTKEIQQFIPKGYEALNDLIYFGQFEALNTLPLFNDGDIKNLFKLAHPIDKSTVISDSDAQMLFYVPLTHILKLYSVLLSFKKPEAGENLQLDDIEETQLPNLIKVWANENTVKSFDDCEDAAPHVEKIAETSESVWYETKVKFVRFQNVQSLTIFVDGEDEDYHTILDKIVLVGVSGESKDQGSLAQVEDN